jgi:hypothetical protein
MGARGEKARRYAAGAVRVGAYFGVVAAVGAVLVAGRARAAVGDAALEVGRELARLDATGPVSRVRLNGELVNVSSAMLDESPKQVLDRFEAECRAHAGTLGEELAHLAETAGKPPSTAGGAAVGVVRKDAGDRGVVACLARDDDASIASTIRGARELLATGDLAKLGRLRYVVAERTRGATRTHVVGAWTDGSFDVRALLPRHDADAPGGDSIAAPRPEGSRRLLAASVEGAPYGVRIYETGGDAGDVLARYDRDAAARGWIAEPSVATELAKQGQTAHAYAQRGADLVVVATKAPRDATKVIVSVVEMGAR